MGRTCHMFFIGLIALSCARLIDARTCENVRASAYDRGLLSGEEPFPVNGNPALLSTRDYFRFNLSLYQKASSRYQIGFTYPLSSMSSFGISYFSEEDETIRRVPGAILESVSREQVIHLGLGHQTPFFWGQQLSLHFNQNRFSNIEVFEKNHGRFYDNQSMEIIYRLGVIFRIAQKIKVGFLSAPVFDLRYITFSEDSIQDKQTSVWFRERETDAHLPLAAIEYRLSETLDLAFSNRSRSAKWNPQVALHFHPSVFQCTAALMWPSPHRTESAFGIGAHVYGTDLFAAYFSERKAGEIAFSFSPEREKVLFTVSGIEQVADKIYPYRVREETVRLAQIRVQKEIDDPVELTVRVKSKHVPAITRHIFMKDQSMILPVSFAYPNESLPPGFYPCDLEIIGYARGRQTFTQTFNYEMKESHDWSGEIRDLFYFLMPGAPAIHDLTRSITCDLPTELDRIEGLYEYVRQHIRYTKDPVPANHREDRVQYPQETIKTRSGDCEDLSVLMISMLQNIGLNGSFVGVMPPNQKEGHVFILAELSSDMFSQILENQNLQNFVIRRSGEKGSSLYLPLEMSRPDLNFKQSWMYALEQYQHYAVDREGLARGWVRMADPD